MPGHLQRWLTNRLSRNFDPRWRAGERRRRPQLIALGFLIAIVAMVLIWLIER